MKLDNSNELILELEDTPKEEINDFEFFENKFACASEDGNVLIKSSKTFNVININRFTEAGLLCIQYLPIKKYLFIGDDTGIVHILDSNLKYIKKVGGIEKDCITSLHVGEHGTWIVFYIMI